MNSPRVIEQGGQGGYFRIYAQAPGSPIRDITFFRGAPTQVGQLSSTDPFGDASASLTFPQITGMDRPGTGDLKWLVPYSNIDIIYFREDGSFTDWRWEGLIVSEDISTEGYSVAVQGALYQLDNFVAAPWYPQYPVPYELLIQMMMNPANNPTLRTGALKIEFPDNWSTTVPSFNEPDYLWFLRPYGVSPGQKWTGLVTRSTGGWEPKLTGLVQSLLSVMYTEEGQWTVRKRPGRVPVLMVRPHPTEPAVDTPYVNFGAPGVSVSLSRDFTQSANVIYGAGSDLGGSEFSGMNVSADGQKTFYEPFAALPYVHPAEASNPRLNRNIVRKETRLQLPTGMDELAGRDVAQTHLRRFADPGYTGSIALTSDPMSAGRVMSRFLIKAGDSIVVHGFRGGSILLHVTEVQANLMEGTVSLSVDSKFRDALTVAEVKARTRDALDPVHLLQVGRFSTTVQDQILPWSYAQGSGVIPSGGEHDATEFFTKRLGANSRFPWTDFTTKFPPKDFPHYYIRATPHAANADHNWANLGGDKIALGFPIRMAQQGTIRLLQIACYDSNGRVYPARFHFSIYNNSGVTSRDMPMIPEDPTEGAGGYKAGERYPFFQGAFERMNPDGTETDNPGRLLHDSAGLVVGWGNYYEEAGYYPGRFSAGGPKTGMLVDEGQWSFDTTMDPDFDKYSVENTRSANTTGLLYGMIYVDHHGNRPLYFMGRSWRVEPGS